jgi:hypothetical protein
MTSHGKKPRPLTREDRKYKDDRLFIIATEDTHAPDQYFRVFGNARIHVTVLPTKDGLSSPEHVFQRLDAFREEFQTTEDDEFWLMLDTDHWIEPNHVATFRSVCTEAVQKGYELAHSNPCFEVWLLLHVTDLDAGEQFQRCADVEQRLRDVLGEYSKRRINREKFSRDDAMTAVERAEKLDGASDDRWPAKTGSHVYRVVKKLLQGLNAEE